MTDKLTPEQLVAHLQNLRDGRDVAVILKALRDSGALVDGSLRGANLGGANLGGANLRGAYLWGADLRGADLQGANLGGANLRGANLWGANLRGANLRGAYLWGADLQRADLRGADLQGADLRGADLQGANLENIRMSWTSHALISEILSRAATTLAQAQFVAFVGANVELCWEEWMRDEVPAALTEKYADATPAEWQALTAHRAWAIGALTPFVKDDEVAPWLEFVNEEQDA
jgi:hypothetical protein